MSSEKSKSDFKSKITNSKKVPPRKPLNDKSSQKKLAQAPQDTKSIPKHTKNPSLPVNARKSPGLLRTPPDSK